MDSNNFYPINQNYGNDFPENTNAPISYQVEDQDSAQESSDADTTEASAMGNPEALSNQLAPNDPTFRLQLLNFMQSPNYPNHTSIPEALVSACVAAGQDGRSVCQLPKKGTSDGTSSPCHKRYSRPDRLRDHLNSHLQVKPYLHEGTSLWFTSNNARMAYIKRHDQPRVTCDICGFPSTRQNISRHRKRCERSQAGPSTEATG